MRRAAFPLTRSLALRASSSRLPALSSPQTDRYLVIHQFFTRQAALHVPSRPALPKHFPEFRRFVTNEPSPPPPSDASSNSRSPPSKCANCPTPTPSSPPSHPPSHTPKAPPGHVQDYIPFIRNLIHRSGTIPEHRPTREELLKAADSWWQRFRIRLKWFTIRGWRRFNADDLSAFLSWFLVGNTLWILIGTTTFVSAIFATLNSLSMQEYVARWISDYLTSETGVTVIFESAIVPKWGSSKIAFHNVYVSRRPQTKDSKSPKTTTATPPDPVAYLFSKIPYEAYNNVPPAAAEDNYTMFDINFDTVEVTLSLRRWFDGKGLVESAAVRGVRGVIDRRSVWWDMSKPLRPEDYRHKAYPGDFELEHFHVEDFLITVYHPGGQRPFNVSIFNANFAPFRKRWLFYDMISAESMTGQYDNCLFSLHMPQKLGRGHKELDDAVGRLARFRIDGLPIEHAQYAAGYEGPMSWITSGKLDAVLDIKFPRNVEDEIDVKAIIEEIGRNVVTIAQTGVHPQDSAGNNVFGPDGHIADTIAATGLIPGQARLARPPLRAPEYGRPNDDNRQVTIDIDLRFRDLRAAVPVFTSDLTVTRNALIRPIVAFINANRTLVPIHCQVAAQMPAFEGSWTLFETGLMSSISDQIYGALAHHVSSEAANQKRLRQVSIWGIQRGAEVLLDTLKTVVDPSYNQTATATA